MSMNITKRDVLKILSELPLGGKYFNKKLEKSILTELRLIESRFSLASSRFAVQLHDLYDCLKYLEAPINVKVENYHHLSMTIHTKSVTTACSLIDSLNKNYPVKVEDYFKTIGMGKQDFFLNWFSDENGFNTLLVDSLRLLLLYCSNVPRTPNKDGDPYLTKKINCNPQTEMFIGSKWFKLLILDLIQSLCVVLEQRTGN